MKNAERKHRNILDNLWLNRNYEVRQTEARQAMQSILSYIIKNSPLCGR